MIYCETGSCVSDRQREVAEGDQRTGQFSSLSRQRVKCRVEQCVLLRFSRGVCASVYVCMCVFGCVAGSDQLWLASDVFTLTALESSWEQCCFFLFNFTIADRQPLGFDSELLMSLSELVCPHITLSYLMTWLQTPKWGNAVTPSSIEQAKKIMAFFYAM